MTFADYIAARRPRDDAQGDLVRALRRHIATAEIGTLDELKGLLLLAKVEASPEAMAAARTVWRSYERARSTAQQPSPFTTGHDRTNSPVNVVSNDDITPEHR